jgi:putative Mn2+ efflux pump MntP
MDLCACPLRRRSAIKLEKVRFCGEEMKGGLARKVTNHSLVMMGSFVFTAFVLSVDSFVVAIALSPSIPTLGARCWMASFFGLCDGIAVLAGFFLSQIGLMLHISETAVPLCVLVYGIYFLIAAQWKHFRGHSRLVYLLPVFMSLDNLAYGMKVSQATTGVAVQAVALALASATLAAGGLFLGSLVRFAGPRTSRLATGMALLMAALILSLI